MPKFLKKFFLSVMGLFLIFHPTTKNACALEQESYTSQYLTITVQEYKTEDQRYWVAEIIASDQVPIKGANANDTTETVSSMASRSNAVLAINASGFHNDSGIIPMGIIIRNGAIVTKDPSFKKESLAVMANGDFKFYKLQSKKNIEELNIENSFTFGPVLIRNGEKPEFEDTSRHPRTAIGQVDKHHYIIAIVEGRMDGAIGMTFAELQDVLLAHGCKNAYNLDGGGSTTLYFNGRILNRLSDESERQVVDMIYF